MFAIEGKVALISGALGGIGRCFTKELLRHNIKGLALLDISDDSAKKFLEELEREFGKVDVIFIKADMSVPSEITDAYEKIVKHFNQLDIVINNAGIIDEFNVENTIKTNLLSVAFSTNLASSTYLPKYRVGEEGVILNTASLAGVLPVFSTAPLYSMTKAAIIAMGRCYGNEDMYELRKVKVLTICPGLTQTSIIVNPAVLPELVNSNAHQKLLEQPVQSPEHVAQSIIDIICKGCSGSIWGVNGMETAKEIDYTKFDNMILSMF